MKSDNPTRCVVLPLAVVSSLLLARVATAQDNYEIQVYSFDLVPPHHTMVELHSNFTFEGSKEIQDGVRPTNHALHETIEITHGFTPWFETGFYIFTSARSGDGWDWVGDHIRPRFSVPESWHWPVGLSILDMAWGTLVSGVASIAGKLALDYFNR